MSEKTNPSPADATRPAGLASRLQRMIEAERGADTRVINFRVMEDGHAGLTFGFDVVDTAGAALGSYVLKMAPAGVTRRGNTDVYKQAPLLRALRGIWTACPRDPLGFAGR